MISYKEIIMSRNGIQIPVFLSGKTVDSRYAPDREAKRLSDNLKPGSSFIILIGVGSGCLAEQITAAKKNAFVLGIESSSEDIEFLSQLEKIRALRKNHALEIVTPAQLAQKILSTYLPSFYGGLEVIEQAGWAAEKPDEAAKTKAVIQATLKAVSADYSVQSHFGRLWMHNIADNLRTKERSGKTPPPDFPLQKTACIIAAGPSLDKKLGELAEQREQLYIIATDTALTVLQKNRLYADAVVSLDGQSVSHSHFYGMKKETLCIFDLCANSSAVASAARSGAGLMFAVSGHPLCELAKKMYPKDFIRLYSGAGTVTIAACDLAINAGFKKIRVYGADFSYTGGKPYTRGTYLSQLYGSEATRVCPQEQQFTRLMLRTPLIDCGSGRQTTELLDSYKKSFEDYLYARGMEFNRLDDVYLISGKGEQMLEGIENSFSYKNFSRAWSAEKPEEPRHITRVEELTMSDISLLPLISQLKSHDNNSGRDFDFYLELAYSYAQGYFRL